MDVHLRELRSFVAVAEHLHFGRAAEALYVSQPALSKQIRALEGQLRVRLFERDRRTVRLTAAGTALLPQIRNVLAAWADAEAELAATAAETAATLVVGISTGLGRGLLPAIRARFADAAPTATLQLRQIGWADTTGGLTGPAEEGCDAAFVWLPLAEPERYDWITVATEQRLVLLPAGHRLAGAEAIPFESLLDEPFLALPAAAGVNRDFWLATESRGGRPPVIGAEIASTDETREALGAGLGVCLVAAGNVPLFRGDDIAVRPVTGVPPSELVLAWRRGDRRPLLRTLIEATGAGVGPADVRKE
ncbi:LysR family transcriptional regulator [Microlunatus parietis]|uniref:DNA-binding transcriptional LysR family regulator n=1 Tax=Microlunatus parietis TaxID=682979 RepID=A0A7Y9LCN6_9ACTN|nr:LysR family transcriptional regulator [Microlunatus parietis]NYE71116.1 DNA-binding transcriptional LysR family regulator [Microlunatus parietis]